MNIKGVNLGNWLVLEKWMNPAMFEGTDAEDEYWLPRRLPREEYEARIKMHRREYISERDFITIQSWGLNTVRIPVPYFIFGDREPFIGCVEELDRAFDWAEKYDLQILIDLHTSPYSQNGFDNGGICGVCKWCQMPEEVAFELSVLERLAERYGQRKGLWGIEIINEPMLEHMWDIMNVPERYIAVDKEMAEGSKGISLAFLQQFYLDAYDAIRKHMPEEKYVVFHDGFGYDVKFWKDFMREDKYKNVVVDTHLYLMFVEALGLELTKESYLKVIEEQFAGYMEEMEQYFPIICGEWCLFNSMAYQIDSPEERKVIYQTIGKAQLEAWKKGSGYFYWNYKMLADSAQDSGINSWDLGRCIDLGWLKKEDL